jgi:high-affinity iron transporter
LRALLLEVKTRYGVRTEASPWSAGLQSFLILLREGVEALLVVAALAAYVRRQGSGAQARALWGGVAAAVILSLISAWALARLVANSGATREAIEGVSMLAAAGVLFYASYWLFAKREAARWQAYIKHQVQAAVSRGSLIALALAGFLAVYREGAETVLFYQALIAGQPGQGLAMLAGAGVAALALTGVYVILHTGSRRLPLGQFFGATAVLLYLLAFSFTGKGVVELQTAGWLPATRLDWGPEFPLLGVFPTLESLLPQGLLLMAGIWALTVLIRSREDREQAVCR